MSSVGLSLSWVPGASRERGTRLLLVALVLSALLHGGALFVAVRWGGCICNLAAVVCPKECSEPMPRINIALTPLKPPPPLPKPVIPAQPKVTSPAPAPKAGKVVLPDEAFKRTPVRRAETKLDSPALPENVVVKRSEAPAPVITSAEIFGRADSLQPGAEGTYGLGGTGTATTGPFGTEPKGTGSAPPPPPPAPKPEPRPEPPAPEPVRAEPPPAPTPRGPTRPAKVLNWTDPPYPAQARQQGIEGTVKLRVTVTERGTAQAVSVSQSSGSSALDEAAMAHLGRARFSPALRDGKTVSSTIIFRVKFRLVTS